MTSNALNDQSGKSVKYSIKDVDCSGGGEGGERTDSHIKMTRLLVGNFEKNLWSLDEKDLFFWASLEFFFTLIIKQHLISSHIFVFRLNALKVL